MKKFDSGLHVEEPYRGTSDKALAIPQFVIPKSQWPDRVVRIVGNLIDRYDTIHAFLFIKQLNEITAAALKEPLFHLEGMESPVRLIELVVNKMTGKELEIEGATLKQKRGEAVWEYGSDYLRQLEAESLAKKQDYETAKKAVDDYKAFLEAISVPTPSPRNGDIEQPAKLVSQGVTVSVTFPKK